MDISKNENAKSGRLDAQLNFSHSHCQKNYNKSNMFTMAAISTSIFQCSFFLQKFNRENSTSRIEYKMLFNIKKIV